MAEPRFTNRELLAYFHRFDEKLDSIVAQTTKTNGRVTKLEDEVDEVKIKSENLGVKVGTAVSVITVIISVAITQLFK